MAKYCTVGEYRIVGGLPDYYEKLSFVKPYQHILSARSLIMYLQIHCQGVRWHVVDMVSTCRIRHYHGEKDQTQVQFWIKRHCLKSKPISASALKSRTMQSASANTNTKHHCGNAAGQTSSHTKPPDAPPFCHLCLALKSIQPSHILHLERCSWLQPGFRSNTSAGRGGSDM